MSTPPPTEILWQDFKGAAHEQTPANLNDLKQPYEEEIPTHGCERFIKSYRKCLLYFKFFVVNVMKCSYVLTHRCCISA